MAKVIECFYGPSGSAKSTALLKVIEMMWNVTGQKARVLVGDGSKVTYEPAISAGVCEALDYSIRPWPITTLKHLLEGYWPADVNDPKSPLLPPKVEEIQKIGVWGIEGLAVAGNYIMGDQKGGLANRSARGEKIGGESAIKVIDADVDQNGNPIKGANQTGYADAIYGGNTMGHWGFTQRRLSTLIETSKGLPGWVIWTTHERAAENKVSNEKVIGPEGVGEAMTANLSRVFNNTLHFTTAAKLGPKKEDEHTKKQIIDLDVEYRIYTRDHFNPDGTTMVRYRAVSRTPDPANMPLYLESSEPGKSIEEFYSRIKAAQEKAGSRFKKAEDPAA